MQSNKVNVLKNILWMSVLMPVMLSLSLFGANPIRIMALGDSITLGIDNTDNLTAETWISYRGPLWTKLSTGGYNVDFVGSQASGSDYNATDPSFDLDHEGHNGVEAGEIAGSVPIYLFDNPADIVLLHIGTNDLDRGQTIESTVDDVNTTLEEIDTVSIGIKVILARIINQYPDGDDNKTTNFNIALENMVQKRITNGDDIIILDMEKGADINYTTDMVKDLLLPLHPNVTGYAKMADLWYSALSTVITPIVPEHLWKLDEISGPTYVDSSLTPAEGNCTDPGCPVPVLGQVNIAQSFDGNDTIDVMNSSTFNWTTDANITIEYWMKADKPSNGENEVIIGRKGQLGSGSTDIWFVGLDLSGQVVCGIDNSDGVALQLVRSPALVDDNNWNHIATVITGDRIKIYINGQINIDALRTTTGEHIQGTTPVNIGYLDWATGFEYTGQLDELTVYAAELSAGLIQQHYKNGLKPHLAEVTPVVTDTLEYTFSSDRNGTIAYGGSCTSTTIIATVGDNTIIFNTLADGTYSDCTITVTSTEAATDGNVSDPLAVTAFVVDNTVPDTTAPILTEVTAVTTPTSDTTPAYTFSSSEAGTITYDGSCSSDTTAAVIGNNTITFNALTDGTYDDCTITVTDAATNVSDPLAVTEFVVDTTLPTEPVDPTDPTLPTLPNNDNGGSCTFNPNSKGVDMTIFLLLAMGLLYPFRRRFIK